MSSSSNFAQNTRREQVTALDNPSNKSSNLDKLLMEEAVEKQLDEVQHAQPVTKTQESISPASRAIAPSPAAPELAALTKSGEAIAPPSPQPDFYQFPHQDGDADYDAQKMRAFAIARLILAIRNPIDFFAIKDDLQYSKEELNWVQKNLISKQQRDNVKAILRSQTT